MKSKLEELIEKLCPNGVEYRELEKIITIISPPKKILSKNITLQGKYPVIDQGADYISGYTDDTEALLPDNNYIIFGDHTETIKYVDFKFAQGADGIKILVTKDFHCKYLYYCFTNFYEPTGKYTRHWSKAKTTLIPLPPLEIQEEIVRILDKFTELTTELTLRKQQYEHYRDELLTFGDEIPIFPLDKLAQYSKEKINASEINETNYVGVDNLLQNKRGKVNSNYVQTKGNLTKYEKEDILIGNIRPYLKKIWFSDNFGGASNDVLVIQNMSDKILSKYLYMILCSEKFFDYNIKNSKGAKMPRGSKEAIMKYSIPVPSLEEQKRIVEILDRFDKYINDIKEGLPAEIEMRQKQYEYYRDKLLDLKKLN